MSIWYNVFLLFKWHKWYRALSLICCGDLEALWGIKPVFFDEVLISMLHLFTVKLCSVCICVCVFKCACMQRQSLGMRGSRPDFILLGAWNTHCWQWSFFISLRLHKTIFYAERHRSLLCTRGWCRFLFNNAPSLLSEIAVQKKKKKHPNSINPEIISSLFIFSDILIKCISRLLHSLLIRI